MMTMYSLLVLRILLGLEFLILKIDLLILKSYQLSTFELLQKSLLFMDHHKGFPKR